MRTTSQADLAVRLRLAVARTARRLRQEAGEELSPSQAAALATIDRHGPLTPSELADRERVRRPTATRLIAVLEDAGLVDRTRDPLDGRSFLVALSPGGRELLARVRTRKNAYLSRRLRELSPEDRATLDHASAILERLLEEDGAAAG
jgi:DNA-binding MarR family transcriptional regulator